ncbi:hypothetical protein INT43_007637 [Umbelopsis isabellina]|uniref:Pyridoxamine 5'-phosphate oxidase Alr4036 family FMN-binding domain-containing protein n=1 Tax=Mortierella isabellina TaxID=91625 RepID=A0A8H7PNC1_MORIS|nr:hypothetical protein INT43_007637 [Umbelopsis isabellina]
MPATNPAWKQLILGQLAKNIKDVKDAAYVQLSTIRLDGSPANRTVAFRGFAAEDHAEETGWESDLLLFTCDKRTEKMKELQHDSRVEIAWWMSKTGDQFRIRGRMHMIERGTTDVVKDHIAPKQGTQLSSNASAPTSSFLARLKHFAHSVGKPDFSWEAERLRQWYKISDDLRATFTWPHPGKDFEHNGRFIEKLAIEKTKDDGWFSHSDQAQQSLLEEGYNNFVLLVVEVDSVDYVELYSMPCKRRVYTKHNDQWDTRLVNP